jgi:hypothetical protein
MLHRITIQNRARWPKVRILLRADGASARAKLMLWCEEQQINCRFGSKKRLTAHNQVRTRQNAP